MEQVLPKWGEVGGCWHHWEVVWHWWESGRKMNMEQIRYIVETVPGIRGGGMKESRERDEFKYDIFDTLQIYKC
jgi:hypothetical protein